MHLVFPYPVTMVKSHEEKCQNYLRVDYDHYDMLKSRRQNVNFEEIDTERATGKNKRLKFK